MGSRIGDEESVENRMDSTDQKPADVLTHSTSQTEFWRLLGLLGIRVTDGPLQGLSEGGVGGSSLHSHTSLFPGLTVLACCSFI